MCASRSPLAVCCLLLATENAPAALTNPVVGGGRRDVALVMRVSELFVSSPDFRNSSFPKKYTVQWIE